MNTSPRQYATSAMAIDPFVYIEDVLRRINGQPAHRLDELLPGNWQKAESYY